MIDKEQLAIIKKEAIDAWGFSPFKEMDPDLHTLILLGSEGKLDDPEFIRISNKIIEQGDADIEAWKAAMSICLFPDMEDFIEQQKE